MSLVKDVINININNHTKLIKYKLKAEVILPLLFYDKI